MRKGLIAVGLAALVLSSAMGFGAGGRFSNAWHCSATAGGDTLGFRAIHFDSSSYFKGSWTVVNDCPNDIKAYLYQRRGNAVDSVLYWIYSGSTICGTALYDSIKVLMPNTTDSCDIFVVGDTPTTVNGN